MNQKIAKKLRRIAKGIANKRNEQGDNIPESQMMLNKRTGAHHVSAASVEGIYKQLKKGLS